MSLVAEELVAKLPYRIVVSLNGGHTYLVPAGHFWPATVNSFPNGYPIIT